MRCLSFVPDGTLHPDPATPTTGEPTNQDSIQDGLLSLTLSSKGGEGNLPADMYRNFIVAALKWWAIFRPLGHHNLRLLGH